MTLTLTGNTAVSDFYGNIRTLPISTKSTTYTLVASDKGKLISTSANVAVPPNVFSPGEVVCIYNNSASNITITQGSSVRMNLVGTTFTGNRTLAQRGFSTVQCTTDGFTFIVTGGGLT